MASRGPSRLPLRAGGRPRRARPARPPSSDCIADRSCETGYPQAAAPLGRWVSRVRSPIPLRTPTGITYYSAGVAHLVSVQPQVLRDQGGVAAAGALAPGGQARRAGDPRARGVGGAERGILGL